MGVLAGLVSMLSWGTGDFVAATLSRAMGNLRALVWVTLFGDLFIVVYALLQGSLSGITFSAGLFAAVGGFLHTIGSLSFYKGLRVGKVSLVAPISSGWSIILVLAGVFLYGEVLSGARIAGILLVIVGAISVSTELRELRVSSRIALSDPGISYAFVAMFAWGAGWLFFNEAVKAVSWVVPNIVLESSILLFLVFYGLTSKQSIAAPAGRREWLGTAFVGLATVLAYVSYSIGIERYMTSIVGPLAAAYPLVAVLLAGLLLREKTAFNQKLGIAGVVLGVALMSV